MFWCTPSSTCNDVSVLRNTLEEPATESLRQQVGTHREELAEVHALLLAGKAKKGLEKALALAKDVSEVPYLPLRAEVMYEVGRLQGETGAFPDAVRSLVSAMIAAERVDYPEMRARIGLTLGFVNAVGLKRHVPHTRFGSSSARSGRANGRT